MNWWEIEPRKPSLEDIYRKIEQLPVVKKRKHDFLSIFSYFPELIEDELLKLDLDKEVIELFKARLYFLFFDSNYANMANKEFEFQLRGFTDKLISSVVSPVHHPEFDFDYSGSDLFLKTLIKDLNEEYSKSCKELNKNIPDNLSTKIDISLVNIFKKHNISIDFYSMTTQSEGLYDQIKNHKYDIFDKSILNEHVNDLLNKSASVEENDEKTNFNFTKLYDGLNKEYKNISNKIVEASNQIIKNIISDIGLESTVDQIIHECSQNKKINELLYFFLSQDEIQECKHMIEATMQFSKMTYFINFIKSFENYIASKIRKNILENFTVTYINNEFDDYISGQGKIFELLEKNGKSFPKETDNLLSMIYEHINNIENKLQSTINKSTDGDLYLSLYYHLSNEIDKDIYSTIIDFLKLKHVDLKDVSINILKLDNNLIVSKIIDDKIKLSLSNTHKYINYIFDRVESVIEANKLF